VRWEASEAARRGKAAVTGRGAALASPSQTPTFERAAGHVRLLQLEEQEEEFHARAGEADDAGGVEGAVGGERVQQGLVLVQPRTPCPSATDALREVRVVVPQSLVQRGSTVCPSLSPGHSPMGTDMSVVSSSTVWECWL